MVKSSSSFMFINADVNRSCLFGHDIHLHNHDKDSQKPHLLCYLEKVWRWWSLVMVVSMLEKVEVDENETSTSYLLRIERMLGLISGTNGIVTRLIPGDFLGLCIRG